MEGTNGNSTPTVFAISQVNFSALALWVYFLARVNTFPSHQLQLRSQRRVRRTWLECQCVLVDKSRIALSELGFCNAKVECSRPVDVLSCPVRGVAVLMQFILSILGRALFDFERNFRFNGDLEAFEHVSFFSIARRCCTADLETKCLGIKHFFAVLYKPAFRKTTVAMESCKALDTQLLDCLIALCP